MAHSQLRFAGCAQAVTARCFGTNVTQIVRGSTRLLGRGHPCATSAVFIAYGSTGGACPSLQPSAASPAIAAEASQPTPRLIQQGGASERTSSGSIDGNVSRLLGCTSAFEALSVPSKSPQSHTTLCTSRINIGTQRWQLQGAGCYQARSCSTTSGKMPNTSLLLHLNLPGSNDAAFLRVPREDVECVGDLRDVIIAKYKRRFFDVDPDEVHLVKAEGSYRILLRLTQTLSEAGINPGDCITVECAAIDQVLQASIADRSKAFCASHLRAAAHADYALENEEVLISFEDVSDGRITILPFVNRLGQLNQAASALLYNKQLALSEDYDPRQLSLVVSSHLFGAGKTAFAKRLFRGLNTAFRGKMFYALSIGVPEDSASVVQAVTCMVVDAAVFAGVISMHEAETLRSGRSSISSVIHVIQTRLVSNEGKSSAISELFLHFDEFDLSHISLLQHYRSLREADPLTRYDAVWLHAFVPILRAPNLHLVITGRAPELAILGTRSDSASRNSFHSPTLAFQAVLGTLHSEHILDILWRLKIQSVKSHTKSSNSTLFRVLLRSQLCLRTWKQTAMQFSSTVSAA